MTLDSPNVFTRIGIVGCGLVGRELVKQLGKFIPALYGVSSKFSLQLVGVTNSLNMILFDHEKTFSQIEDVDSWLNQLKTHKLSGLQSLDLDLFASHLSADGKAKAILVDCTSSEKVASYYCKWLQSGLHIVTPNKKAFSSDLSQYKSIQSILAQTHIECYHEATVGAGLPVLSTLNELLSTGDELIQIEGILSGTLSFIFNRFSPNTSTDESPLFSSIVREAKENGYTEPDPREDLNGMDVARKVIILGRMAGLDISMESLSVENIVPEPLRKCETVPEFMAKLTEYDDFFLDMKQKAARDNMVCRYVGVVDPKGKSSVQLKLYPYSHPFANLRGSDNIISFTTRRYPNSLIIQGSGAGASVTAAGVFGDILKVAKSKSQ